MKLISPARGLFQLAVALAVIGCAGAGVATHEPAAGATSDAVATIVNGATAAVGASAAPSPGGTMTLAGFRLDLTFAGTDIDEHLATGFIPETGESYCNWQTSASDQAVQYPAAVVLQPAQVGGTGWSTFTFTDADGPGTASHGNLTLGVIHGGSTRFYRWAPDTGTAELSKGSASYAESNRTVVLDVSAYDTSAKAYTHIKGTIACSP